jgi:hypothetical protein
MELDLKKPELVLKKKKLKLTPRMEYTRKAFADNGIKDYG